jgi:predicted nuclease with TOPRIM domain
MSNLRQQESLLEENIRLKSEQSEFNKKLDGVLSTIGEKMDRMAKELTQLRERPNTVVEKIVSDSEAVSGTVKTKKKVVEKPFIPSADTSGMKMNVNIIEKKSKKSNLAGAADKLAELQKSDQGKKEE